MLELVEQTFDQMALLKQPPVCVTLSGSMLPTGNDRIRMFFFQQRQDVIGVIPTICHDVLAFDVKGFQDLVPGHTIVDVTGSYFVFQWIAQRIYNGMNLGG